MRGPRRATARIVAGPAAALAAGSIALCVLISCGNRDRAADASAEDRPSERVLEAPSEPEHASYALDLGDAPLALVGTAYPGLPFPKTAVVGKAAIDLVYEESETPFRAFGAMEAQSGEGAARFDFEGPREARRGTSVYRIEGRSLVLSAEGAVPDSRASPAPVRRWEAPQLLVAGPAVFQDRILMATAAPSFVALDRATLALVFERPMEALATGPLVVLSDLHLLIAFHADGSVGSYALTGKGSAVEAANGPAAGGGAAADPVSALIDPAPESLAAMEVKTAALMGKDKVHLSPARLYLPRRALPEEEVTLFRTEADGKGGPMRLYLDGAGGRPYLVAAFNAAGEFIKSNIDYTGAESVLELRFQPGATYFFAVAYLSAADGAAGSAADAGAAAATKPERPLSRFVIVPKK